MRVGIVGAGFIARAHAEAYRRLVDLGLATRVELVRIASVHEDRAATFAARHGVTGPTTDWRTITRADDVDLVDVCSPNDTHAEISMDALAHGKHVLCEKPLARTVDEGLWLTQSASSSAAMAFCSFNYRFVPAIGVIKDLLGRGGLGTVHSFRLSYQQDWGLSAEQSWKFTTTAGSGAVGDLGAHLIDLLHVLVGPVDEVFARSASVVPGHEVEDQFFAVIRTTSGAIGTVSASRVSPGAKNRLEIAITGERGEARWNLERLNELTVVRQGETGFDEVSRLVTEPGDPTIARWWPAGHVLGWEAAMFSQIRAVVQTIAAGATDDPIPVATFADGMAVAAVCDQILTSAGEGRRRGHRGE